MLKDTDRETLFNTIRAAARGETLLRPEVAERVLAPDLVSRPRRRREHNVVPRLTGRERQILDVLTRDHRNREIAARLGISERTVKAHLASIYTKLGVDSRAGAVAKALREGLIEEREA